MLSFITLNTFFADQKFEEKLKTSLELQQASHKLHFSVHFLSNIWSAFPAT
jgi:hypothetical protein